MQQRKMPSQATVRNSGTTVVISTNGAMGDFLERYILKQAFFVRRNMAEIIYMSVSKRDVLSNNNKAEYIECEYSALNIPKIFKKLKKVLALSEKL